MLRVLEVGSSAHLKNPGKAKEIKYLLCPVVAQSEAEQKRFYELFDKYWEDINQPWELPPLPPKPGLPAYVRSLVLAVVFGAMGLALVIFIKGIEPHCKVFFAHEPIVHEGEMIEFFNQSTIHDKDSTKITWKIFDAKNKRLERTVADSFHLKIIADRQGGSPNKIVRLLVEDGHWRDSFESPLVIRCSRLDLPKVDSIIAPATAAVGEVVRFGVQAQADRYLAYSWQFGDGTPPQRGIAMEKASRPAGANRSVFLATTEHTFEQAGTYTVSLTARHSSLDSCETVRTHLITIGQDTLPLIAAKPLSYDEIKPEAHYAWLSWTLAFLLALTSGWLWLRWFATQKTPAPPPPEGEQPKPEPTPPTPEGELTTTPTPEGEQTPLIPAFDKAPYSIPFRSQAANVRIERPLFRLADVLRQRQEGLRRELDLPASLAATVQDGGFPRLKTAVATVPTDYLFLVDEPAPGSHSAKLFRFIMDFFIKQREVLGEVYFFSGEPNRFWNDQTPEPILPEQLQRLHGDSRLVVIADGHAWLDADVLFRPVAVAAPLDFLRPEVVAFFKNWKRRLLLTPMPVAEWTYREGALHELFDVFPADSEGLGEASKHVERPGDDENRPTYAAWSERLRAALRQSPTAKTAPSVRRWNTAAEHRQHLPNEPLYQWVRRLALYPKPDWNLTIAIGKAIGADVSYDNLLALSRVPWLQSGELPHRVCKELTAGFSLAETQAVRVGIVRELAVVSEQVKGSFAGRQHEVLLAVNAFALNPNDPAAKAEIRRLHDAKRLTPRDVWELDTSLAQHFSPAATTTGTQLLEVSTALESTAPPAVPLKIGDFLAEETSPPAPQEEPPPPPPPPKPPFFNAQFYRAAAATLAFFALFIFMGATDATDWLFRTRFGQEPVASVEYAENLPKGDALVRVLVEAEEAVLHNNAGVTAYRERFDEEGTETPQWALFDSMVAWVIQPNFQKAIEASQHKTYPLAESNQSKVQYNLAVKKYNWFLSEKRDTVILRQAHSGFDSLTQNSDDSLYLDALHGYGLTSYYLNGIDSARAVYQLLLDKSDGQYFNPLSLVPNLEKLVLDNQPAPPPGVETRTISVQVLDDETGKPVENVRVTSTGFTNRTDINGRVSVRLEVGKQQRFEFRREDYFLAKQDISTRRTLLPVRLKFHPYKYPLKPNFNPLIGSKGRAQVFGSFTYKSAGVGTDNFIVTDDWVEKNIVQVEIPQLNGVEGFPSSGKIRFHRLGAKQLQAAFAEIERAGLLDRIIQWNGSYVQRFVRGRPSVLSNHSWGSAFDINLAWNGLGRVPALKGEKGSVRELVQIFNKHGFYWGGHFSRLDGNHFEVAVLTQDAMPVEPIIEDEKQPELEPIPPVVFDRDGDGVTDAVDKCPDQKGLPENGGCPIVTPPPAEFREPEVVFVQGGTFTMGCNEKVDKDCEDNEKPPHEVTVSDFSIGKYEVTNEQYATFLNDYGSTTVKEGEFKGEKMIDEQRWAIEFPKEDMTVQNNLPNGTFKPQAGYEKYPVVNVSWFGANEYCRWLSKKTGKNYRLPTEAEWEYAAKGGRTQPPFIYSGSNDLFAVAWFYSGASGGETHPIGGKKANDLGIFDMSGNVYEWCSDWYDESYYKQFQRIVANNPKGPSKGQYRVFRGGAWNDKAIYCRVSNRDWSVPSIRYNDLGFRCTLAQD